MKCEQHLALEAIIVGLRRSGVIDKRAVHTIAAALDEAAAEAQQHCLETADGLARLAVALKAGPARSCKVSVAA